MNSSVIKGECHQVAASPKSRDHVADRTDSYIQPLLLQVGCAPSPINDTMAKSQLHYSQRRFRIEVHGDAVPFERFGWVHQPETKEMDQRFTPYQRKSAKKAAVPSQGFDVWTPEEDDVLRSAVYKHGGKKWKTIATFFAHKSPSQCNHRWNELQNHGTAVKMPWSPNEDLRMLELVKTHGAGKWAVIASYLPGRNGKQCRERWHNQLNPAIRKGPWTSEEDSIILEMQSKFGNRWAKITEKLPGRTDNAVKNHWHSSMKARAKQTPVGCDTRRGGETSPSQWTVETATCFRGLVTSESHAQVGDEAKIKREAMSPDSVTMPLSPRISAMGFPAMPQLDDEEDILGLQDMELPQEIINEVLQVSKLAPADAIDEKEGGTEYVTSLLDEFGQDRLVLSTDETESNSSSGSWFVAMSDAVDHGSSDDLLDDEDDESGETPPRFGCDSWLDKDGCGGNDDTDAEFEDDEDQLIEVCVREDDVVVVDGDAAADAALLEVLLDLPVETPFEWPARPEELETSFVDQHTMLFEEPVGPAHSGPWGFLLPDEPSPTVKSTESLDPLLYDDASDGIIHNRVLPLSFEEACDFVCGSTVAAAARAEATVSGVLQMCDLT